MKEMNKIEIGTDLPLACNLTEAQEREQRQREITATFKAIEQVVELEDGYAFSFAPSEERAYELLTFILAERKCCPFFTFELAFEAAEGPIWLRLRGPEGVKEFVREAFYQDVNAASRTSPQ